MKISNVFQSRSRFKILETTERSQTALMALNVGEASSEEPNSHAGSDQILIVLEGELDAHIGGEQAAMRRGDSVIVPADAPHKFTNTGSERAVIFTAYSPPAYPPDLEE